MIPDPKPEEARVKLQLAQLCKPMAGIEGKPSRKGPGTVCHKHTPKERLCVTESANSQQRQTKANTVKRTAGAARCHKLMFGCKSNECSTQNNIALEYRPGVGGSLCTGHHYPGAPHRSCSANTQTLRGSRGGRHYENSQSPADTALPVTGHVARAHMSLTPREKLMQSGAIPTVGVAHHSEKTGTLAEAPHD